MGNMKDNADNPTVTVNVSLIPDVRRDELLEAMTAPLTAFYADPKNQEKYKAWLEQRRAARKE